MCGKIPQKEMILSILIFVFKKGMEFLSKKDSDFQKIVANLPDNFIFAIKVKNSHLQIYFKKTNGIIKKAKNSEQPHLTLIFNNLCSALLVFAGFIPQHTAFAEHKLSIKGNISDALVITKAINRLQSVIFPDLISKNLIKEFKPSPLKDKLEFVRFYIQGLIL